MRAWIVVVLLLISFPVVGDEPKFGEFRRGVNSLTLASSRVEEAQFKIGSPYWKRISNHNGVAREEWRYPTALRETGVLIFENGILTARHFESLSGDNFIHDDTPIMNRKGMALRDKLRTIKVGSDADLLTEIRKPRFYFSEAEMNQMLSLAESEMTKAGAGSPIRQDRAVGDTWMYECGDLKVSFVIKNGVVIEITELLMPSATQMKRILSTDAQKNF